MTATAEVRAQRRYDELKAKGENPSYEEVFQNVVSRDLLDTTRTDSPLIQANDAKVLDNSGLSREAQFKIALGWARDAVQAAT